MTENREQSIAIENSLSQQNSSIARAPRPGAPAGHCRHEPTRALFSIVANSYRRVSWAVWRTPRTLAPRAQALSCVRHCRDTHRPVTTQGALPIPNPVATEDLLLRHEISNLYRDREFYVVTENRKWAVTHSSSISTLQNFTHSFHPLPLPLNHLYRQYKVRENITLPGTSLNPSFFYKTYHLHISKLDSLSRISQNKEIGYNPVFFTTELLDLFRLLVSLVPEKYFLMSG